MLPKLQANFINFITFTQKCLVCHMQIFLLCQNFDLNINEGTIDTDGSSDVDHCMSFW